MIPFSTTHPEIANLWHPTKNGNLRLELFSAGSDKKVWWKCPIEKDHEWEATIQCRTSGSGCPCCSGNKVVKSNSFLTLYPEIAKQWHPTKNGNLKPEYFTAGSGKKVWWKCDVGEDHEWKTAISNRVHGSRCPCCMGGARKQIVKSNCLSTTNPEIAKQWHPIKNGNLKPECFSADSGKQVWWKCDVAEDHEWIAKIGNRTNCGSGCPCCDGKKVVKSNCLATTNPIVAHQWNSMKNGNLNPEMVTAKSGKKVWWKCIVGHEWQARIADRTNGVSCPVCNESKGEKAVKKYLEENNIFYNRQHTFESCRDKRPLAFDFFIKYKNYNAVIEYQGQQHYYIMRFVSCSNAEKKLKQIKKHDKIKRDWCKKESMALLEIPYWEFDNIGIVMENFLNRLPNVRHDK